MRDEMDTEWPELIGGTKLTIYGIPSSSADSAVDLTLVPYGGSVAPANLTTP